MPPASETPSAIWSRLTKNSIRLCFYLGPLTATSQSPEFLKAMADDPSARLDLRSALKELQSFGILEQVTYLQELSETVERLASIAPPKHWFKDPDIRLTDSQLEYVNAVEALNRAEASDNYREMWIQPRFRLSPAFKAYVASQMSAPPENL